MRMRTKKRRLSVLVAAGYVLIVTTASLFHNHSAHDDGGCGNSCLTTQAESSAGHHGEPNQHSPRPTAPSQRPTDDSQCPVCQFLAQKPAPTAEAARVDSGILVQEAFLSSPACIAVGVFSAWRSRAPPSVA